MSIIKQVKSFEPFGDMVVLKKDKEANKIGSLFLPEGSRTSGEYDSATVRFCGPGKHTDNGILIPIALKPGDRVLYNKYSEVDIKVGEETLCMLNLPNILGKIIEDDKAEA